jgi:hypothetical protein
MRFPGSLKIIISSVHRRSGLLHDKYAAHFGRDDDDVLVVLGTSLQFNPTLDAAEIDRQLALDPEKAGAEYLSQWRDDLTSFLDRQLVEAAIEKGIIARPPQHAIAYTGFCDPSGGRGDSFTAAVGHREGTIARELHRIWDKAAEQPSGGPPWNINLRAPYAAARLLLQVEFSADGSPTLCRHRGGFYAWNGTAFPEVADAEIRAQIYSFLDQCITTRDARPGNRRMSRCGRIRGSSAMSPTRCGLRRCCRILSRPRRGSMTRPSPSRQS